MKNSQVEVYDNFISAANFPEVQKYVTKQCLMFDLLAQNWAGKNYWHPNEGNILKGPVWTTRGGEFPYEAIIIRLAFFTSGIFPYDPTRHVMNMSAFAYPAGSGFGWHQDGNALSAFVLYLSPWQRDWGGELLLEDENGFGSHVQPRENRLVLIKPGVFHKVAPVDFRAGGNIRFTVAGFVSNL